MSAELLEKAIALAHAGKQVRAEILDVRSPIVTTEAACRLVGNGQETFHGEPTQEQE